jgi:uncharacterized protein YndB with AHSA1/START domain
MQHMTSQALRTLVFAVAAAAAANGAVVDSGPSGFTIKISLNIQAPPATVYQKFVSNVGDWWNSAHTFSGSAKNLSIEQKPMGCFCEKLLDGGGVRHMEVLYVAPGKGLVMSGALGPMQPLAAGGTLRLTFAAEGDATKFEATYSVMGYLATGMDKFAPLADGMLTGQLARFKNYVEKGDPGAK